MARFSYQAKEGPEKLVRGVLEADTLNAAIAQVMRLGLEPVDVCPAALPQQRIKRRPAVPFFRSNVSYRDAVFFIQQISDLISAGVPVLRTVVLAADQARNPFFRETLDRMSDEVRNGGTLSEALARRPEVFPRLYGNLVRAGEKSGKLGEVLTRLAELAQRDLEARSQVFSSLIYPAMILVVGSGTIFALLTWVVPRLTGIFEELGASLPLSTMILLGISGFFARFWPLIIALAASGLFYLRRLTATPEGRFWFDGLKLRLPLAGPLIRSVETGRFARIMSTLLGNGVGIVSALEATALVMSNEVVRQNVGAMAEMVRNGSSLALALRKHAVFPETVVTMVAVGEEAGQVHQGLGRMADYFERQAQRTVKTMTTLMEPMLIFVLGLFVGFVVLALLMPVLRMNMIIQ